MEFLAKNKRDEDYIQVLDIEAIAVLQVVYGWIWMNKSKHKQAIK